jgi:hypothetical protein
MAKNVFISFNFKEKGFKNDLYGLFQANGGRIQATPVIVTEDVSAQGEEAIRAVIRQRMTGCAGLVVVVGNDAHNSPWIAYELGMANELGIPKIAVRHPAATGGPPNAHRGMTQVEWSSQQLVDAIASWR